MEDVMGFDIEKLKLLEAPRDIEEAIEDLSRRFSGLVMVNLVSSKSGTDEVDSEIWFNPKYMQEEKDNPKSMGNTHVKFFMDVQQNKLRIKDVKPLAIDNTGPFPIRDALEKFGKEHGFVVRRYDYSGRLTRAAKST